MFTVRPYKEEDAAACGDCFYEGFFSCSVDQNDKILLRDYAQILIEKCNFTYVAETEDHQVVGFICGKYDKRFSKALAAQYETKKHYGRWCKMFLKFYLKRYKMSAPFQKQFWEMRSGTRCPFVQKELQKGVGNRIGHTIFESGKS